MPSDNVSEKLQGDWAGLNMFEGNFALPKGDVFSFSHCFNFGVLLFGEKYKLTHKFPFFFQHIHVLTLLECSTSLLKFVRSPVYP